MFAATLAVSTISSISCLPQLGGLTDLLSGDEEAGEVNGDYEQVPYDVINKLDVRTMSFKL